MLGHWDKEKMGKIKRLSAVKCQPLPAHLSSWMLLILIISQCNSSKPKRDWVYAAGNMCCLCRGLGAFTGWSARVRWGWLGEDILYKILHKNTSSELLPQSWALNFHIKIMKCHGCKERLEKYLPGLSSTTMVFFARPQDLGSKQK